MQDETKPKTKARRKLSDIDFSSEGSHIALCHKGQGVANQAPYQLVVKAVKFSDEAIAKMEQVRVTLELPDFLQRFFSLVEDDAKVLATMLGYKEPVETQVMEDDEAQAELEDWIKSKMESFEILKGLYEADNLVDELSQLDEYQYLSMLQDQSKIEKAFKKIEKLEKAKATQSKESKPSAKAEVEDNPQIAGVDNQVEDLTSVTKNKEVQMTQDVQVIEQEVEVIAKSQFDAIQKAFEDQKAELTKALEIVKALEQEKKEQVEKQRLADVKAAVKDEDHANVIFKAVKGANDEDFQAVVKALSALTAAQEQSDLFVEKGAVVEEQAPVKENHVEKLLKAKFQNK